MIAEYPLRSKSEIFLLLFVTTYLHIFRKGCKRKHHSQSASMNFAKRPMLNKIPFIMEKDHLSH